MITGIMLRNALISASNSIANQRQKVDSLNVFPVPDGDTGSNMSMTFAAAKAELEKMEGDMTVSGVASVCASALLRGARGNSGVITSLLFRGLAKSLKDKKTATSLDIAAALESGVESAYKAVMKPIDGTILTVARLSAEAARASARNELSVSDLWKIVVDSAEDALAKTPDMLPVLKKAGVVDAGGQGLVYIYRGMMSVFEGEGIVGLDSGKSAEYETIHPDFNAAGEFEGDINFAYCTEFIVIKKDDCPDASKLRAFMESVGDCAVMVEDDEIIKCHVHTNEPGNVLQQALEFGALTKMKIENMRLQHEEQQKKTNSNKKSKTPIDPDRPGGFVVVAAGDGVEALFRDLGADQIVSGGQTMNPSTEDILGSIESVPSRVVYVLPNNKNIIMAAEQAAKLCKTREVKVIPTKTIPQGLTALMAFEPGAAEEDNVTAMTHAAEKVGTGQITYAARDSEYDGYKIKEGDLLGLKNGKVAFTERSIEKAVVKLVKSLITDESSFVTLIYGSDITQEQADNVEKALRSKIPSEIDITTVCGGQPVYYFIISVE